ncbi:arrestin domain-containing protein 3-like [Patiria miniata]|uniref:Arrestin C-terminal-like domain-containing protein n=1 Tax=Patiria miniata TaxID=46514 RepID=A0A914BT54_PATMI|nr:arrestin domain-containing protein 3-like [Patiria miniata]
MGKISGFQIVFADNEREVFNGGDIIQGHVRLELDATKQFRGIYMHWKGRAVVTWTEIESRGKSKVTVLYVAGEDYFDQYITIMGKDRTDNDDHRLELPAGTHCLPFKFKLPNRPLPCSFEGTLGYVRFFTRAVIDRPWTFDHVTKRAFTISGIPYDLNKVQNPLAPIYNEDEKTVCCLCCATGPISVSASTDKRAYLPGETVYISATLENRSNRSVHSLEAELIQSVNYYARRDGVGSPSYRTTSHVVTSVVSEACGAYASAHWDRKPMIIPPLPPCNLEGCNFIDIRYYVKFTADVASTPFDVDLMLEIVVGTIPLAGHCYGSLSANQPGSSSGPPPTYEAAIGGQREIRDEHDNEYVFGKLVYTPFYMFYRYHNVEGGHQSAIEKSTTV